jgi:glyoxylase-like metal-dependent hydrolase (beta-lactamase superfamily II)
MFRKILLMSAVTSVVATLVVSIQAQAPKGGEKGKGGAPPPQPQMIQMIKPGFYVVTGAGGNTGVRVTKDGLIVTDTKNLGDQFYNDLMTQIKTVSTLPVKYVFITHHHQDHSGNIGKFEDAGAKVIAYEGLKKNLATYAPPQGKPSDPNTTYNSKSTKVKLGGATVVAYHFGNAHTSGDSIVYYPDIKVVQTGDVVVGVVPNCDYPFGGSVAEWPHVLDEILKLDFDVLVPGHSGPNSVTMTKADLQEYRKKWGMVNTRLTELVKKGTPKDQIMAQLKTDDIGWNLNNQQWNNPQRLDAMVAELSKAK